MEVAAIDTSTSPSGDASPAGASEAATRVATCRLVTERLDIELLLLPLLEQRGLLVVQPPIWLVHGTAACTLRRMGVHGAAMRGPTVEPLHRINRIEAIRKAEAVCVQRSGGVVLSGQWFGIAFIPSRQAQDLT